MIIPITYANNFRILNMRNVKCLFKIKYKKESTNCPYLKYSKIL